MVAGTLGTLPTIARAETDAGIQCTTECHVIGGGGGGGDDEIKGTETAESSYYGAVDIESGIHAYDAEGDTSPGGEDYWKIRFDAASNSQARSNTSEDEQLFELDLGRSVLTSSQDLVTNTNEYWVGGGTRSDPSDDSYEHASNAASAAVGQIPVVGGTISAIDMVYHLYLMYDDNSSGSELYDRTFGYQTDSSQAARQGECYNRFVAEGEPGETGSFTLEETAYGFDVNLAANVTFTVSYEFPSVSPSSTSTMTTSELQEHGIKRVPSKNVKKRPFDYGYTPQEAKGISKDSIIFAELNVSANIETNVITNE